MSAVVPALLAAGAGVGFGHAVLPDHWVPLAVVGRTQQMPLRRVVRLSLAAGVAHVLVSLLLGAVIVIIGLQFRSLIVNAQDALVGGVLIATGLGFLALELTGRGHHHSHDHPDGHSHGHDHDHSHGHDLDEHGHDLDEHGHDLDEHGHDLDEHGHDLDEHEHGHDHLGHGHGRALGADSDRGGLLAVMIPFGAAASPDLTILPVFLAAAAAGTTAAVGTLVIFALVTIATIVGLTVLAFLSGMKVSGAWLDRWGNLITAAALFIIGGLVLAGII